MMILLFSFTNFMGNNVQKQKTSALLLFWKNLAVTFHILAFRSTGTVESRLQKTSITCQSGSNVKLITFLGQNQNILPYHMLKSWALGQSQCPGRTKHTNSTVQRPKHLSFLPSQAFCHHLGFDYQKPEGNLTLLSIYGWAT